MRKLRLPEADLNAEAELHLFGNAHWPPACSQARAQAVLRTDVSPGPLWRGLPTRLDPGIEENPLGAGDAKALTGEGCSQQMAGLRRAVLDTDLALSHFLASRSWMRPVTSLCASISASLKWCSAAATPRPPQKALWD